jgi:hypothetical protein
MRRAAIALSLFGAVALAKPVALQQGQVRNGPLQIGEQNLPLRVVIKTHGVRLANCIFSTQPIPPHARAATVLSDRFSAGDAMFARCYFPDHPGSNRPGDITDVFFLDGKLWWTQAYDAAVPGDAWERAIMLGEILRTPLSTLPPGNHHIEMWGQMKRGKRSVKVYHGEFHYVR